MTDPFERNRRAARSPDTLVEPRLRREDDDGWPVPRGELRVRFLCGNVAGALAGIGMASEFDTRTTGTVMLIVGSALAFGLAAAWIGDRFWKYPGKWWKE